MFYLRNARYAKIHVSAELECVFLVTLECVDLSSTWHGEWQSPTVLICFCLVIKKVYFSEIFYHYNLYILKNSRQTVLKWQNPHNDKLHLKLNSLIFLDFSDASEMSLHTPLFLRLVQICSLYCPLMFLSIHSCSSNNRIYYTICYICISYIKL